MLYPVEFKITFMSGGKVYKEGKFIKNSINGIIPPEPPVKKGYVFKGWYTKEIVDGKEKETFLKGKQDKAYLYFHLSSLHGHISIS